MKPSLKRETIKGLQTENAFNMHKFGDAKELTRKKGIPTQKGGCNTACCTAGHIVSAAKRLGLPMLTPALALKALTLSERREYDRQQLTPQQSKLADRILCLEEDIVAIIARDVWARQYGKEDARRLDFYASGLHYSEVGHVTVESAVKHIRTGAPLASKLPE